MRVSENLLGPQQGKRLNKSIKDQMVNRGMPFGKRRTGQSVEMMAKNVGLNPMRTRVAILISMLRLYGLMSPDVMKALEIKAFVSQLVLAATTMEDGTGGIMKSTLIKHGLIS